MYVEREICLRCLHLADFHLTRDATGKMQCVFGQPVKVDGVVFEAVEGPCSCRKFKP